MLDPRLARVVELLRRPPAVSGVARDRLLGAVRAERDRERFRGRRSRWRWVGGAALAAGVVGLAVGLALRPGAPRSADAVASGGAAPARPAAAGRLADSLPADPRSPRAVQFVLVAPEAARVSVAGDFNGWSPRATPMIRAGTGEVWTASVPLVPGRYRYAFVVDGDQWRPDPQGAVEASDEFGATSVVVVGEGR
jgi:hypothetical protein